VLELDGRVRAGGFTLDIALQADAGDVVAVVGPNGAGKTTLLRCLAGLLPLHGRLRIDGREQADLPPHRRPTGWVPQDGALFPHLSAQDNVAFGLGGRARRAEAQDWLDRLGIGALGQRRPGQLSGGQAQKVALARALARAPRLLLLDEPLAALDLAARTDVRQALRAHLARFDGVTLVVTHDPVDAASLANRLLALEHGKVVQDDSMITAMRAPRSPWLAGLLGANAFRGRVAGPAVVTEDGGRIVVAEPAATDGSEVLAVVPAHAVTLHPRRPNGSARNTWPVTVRELTRHGARVRVDTEGRPAVVAEVTVDAVAELRLHEGAQVWASVKATEVTVVVL
jgi:molybdate transport system permease protein